tara:strand:- start:1456 stop:1611 length:156 start_codon:yes stop_codon:yes gene_type:complete
MFLYPKDIDDQGCAWNLSQAESKGWFFLKSVITKQMLICCSNLFIARDYFI